MIGQPSISMFPGTVNPSGNLFNLENSALNPLTFNPIGSSLMLVYPMYRVPLTVRLAGRSFNE